MHSKEKLAHKEIIARKLVWLAEEGDLAAIKYIFDRLDGRPVEYVESHNEHLIETLSGLFQATPPADGSEA